MADDEIVTPLDPIAVESRIRELTEIQSSCWQQPTISSDQVDFLRHCALQLQANFDDIISAYSDVSSFSSQDLDNYLDHLKGELKAVEAENTKASDEVENLMRSFVEDCNRLEGNIEGLNCSLEIIASQDLEKGKPGERLICSTQGQDLQELLKADRDSNFKILELDSQLDIKNNTLKSLLDLDSTLKGHEKIEKIEDALTGVKVIEFERNCIRMSLRTYIPDFESILHMQRMEGAGDITEVMHELLVEIDEKIELKSVEIFPNDVYIGEIIDAAKSYREVHSTLPVPKTRSPLEWFVRKVQERIILCTLRRLLGKSANKSRYSLEYSDRDEIIVAHMVGGVDALLKVSQGWPLSCSPLKLLSLKGTTQNPKEVSLSFLCKVEEEVNSLDVLVRQTLTSFVDAVEEILVRKMHAELHSGSS